jgi:hypothetical protein
VRALKQAQGHGSYHQEDDTLLSFGRHHDYVYSAELNQGVNLLLLLLLSVFLFIQMAAPSYACAPGA